MFELKWFWENLKGRRALFCVAIFLVCLTSASFVINPSLTSRIVDNVRKGEPFESYSYYFIIMAGATLARTVIRYIWRSIFEESSQFLILTLREKLYNNLQYLDMKFYDSNRVGDIMTKMTGDMEAIRFFCSDIVFAAIEAIVIFVSSLIYLFPIDALLTLSLIAISPCILFLTYKMRNVVRPMYSKIRESFSELNTAVQENISGNRVVKAFTNEEYEIKKFAESNDKYKQLNIETVEKWLKFNPYIDLLANLMTVVSLMLGGIFVVRGRITLGQMTAFTGLTWTLIFPMRMLGQIVNDTQRFFASAEKVMSVYFAKSSINSPEDAVIKDIAGNISFRNVSIKYSNSNEVVLSGINLEIRSGETVGIMGPTGCGKTSLVNLIPRFYDAHEGNILVDGIDVKKYDLQSLRKNIAVTTQDVFLFSDTIEGNISFGNPDMSLEDVKKMAHKAAADFIDTTSDGYDTIIGERGVGLSGGQKQRLALARALAVKAPILILDDTTSAVDMETEKFIQESLRILDYSCTKIIIAQRISSVRDADRIIILKDGGIFESGSHDELMAKKGYYYDLFVLQHGAPSVAGGL